MELSVEDYFMIMDDMEEDERSLEDLKIFRYTDYDGRRHAA